MLVNFAVLLGCVASSETVFYFVNRSAPPGERRKLRLDPALWESDGSASPDPRFRVKATLDQLPIVNPNPPERDRGPNTWGLWGLFKPEGLGLLPNAIGVFSDVSPLAPRVANGPPLVRATTDHAGRRNTPILGKGPRRRHFLLFGCSYAFGHGVADDETLAAQVGRYAPDFRPYNYGVPGFGPQEVLETISRRNLRSEVPESEGVAIYLFYSHHLLRMPPSILSAFVEHPYYYESSDGSIVRADSFNSAFPWTSAVYRLLARSPTLKFFGFQYPISNGLEHARLVARLARQMADEYKRQFPRGEFYVVLFPDIRITAVTRALEAQGVKYLDYSSVTLAERTKKSLLASPYDAHPGAEVHRLVGRQLVTDLGLAKATAP